MTTASIFHYTFSYNFHVLCELTIIRRKKCKIICFSRRLTTSTQHVKITSMFRKGVSRHDDAAQRSSQRERFHPHGWGFLHYCDSDGRGSRRRRPYSFLKPDRDRSTESDYTPSPKRETEFYISTISKRASVLI